VNLILIGAQGSGKGTQAQRLMELLNLKPCASGDLLRKAVADGTPLGQAARPYMDRGDLVPDDLIIAMILEDIAKMNGSKGIILDGFPRNVAQARALDERFAERRQAIDWAVYLDVPRAALLDRLSGRYICQADGHVYNLKTNPPRVRGRCDVDGSPLVQRGDDTPEKIAHRLDIFFTETIRLTDYYAVQGKLLRVDGMGAVDQVTRAILDGVNAAPFDRAVG
jgi:adenylate kinase